MSVHGAEPSHLSAPEALSAVLKGWREKDAVLRDAETTPGKAKEE